MSGGKMRKAVVRESDGLVINVIEWEPKVVKDGKKRPNLWQPPQGCYLVDATTTEGSPGDTWDGEKFIKP